MEIKQQIRILIYKSTFVPYNFADLEKRCTFAPQKEEIQRKGQRRIGRASHGCLSIVIEGQHPRCLWCSIFVPRLS